VQISSTIIILLTYLHWETMNKKGMMNFKLVAGI